MRTFVAVVCVAAIVLAAPSSADTPKWHITATVAESCSCTVSCPCNFGGEPNRHPCEGNRMIAIEQGYYDDVDLAGVSLLVTFEMRTWSKISVSDTVTARQLAAVEALLPIAFAGFHRGMLSFSKAPITMEARGGRVKFSGPEATVEMEVMRGLDGKPITILNLPSPVFQQYTQHKSVVHEHRSTDHTFSHTGTSGFTSTWSAGSPK